MIQTVRLIIKLATILETFYNFGVPENKEQDEIPNPNISRVNECRKEQSNDKQ
jgi:hypothetical protein